MKAEIRKLHDELAEAQEQAELAEKALQRYRNKV